MKKFLALLLSCLMLVSIMTACGEKAPAGGDQGGEKVLNMRLAKGLLATDWAATTNISDMQITWVQVFEGLYGMDEANGGYYELLADNIDIDETGTVYTITLIDAKFQNGDPLKASDVVFSYGVAKENPRFNYVTSFINKIEAKDDKTVVMTLDYPYSAIAHTFWSIKIYNEKEYTAAGDKFGTVPHKAGTGPYYIDQYDVSTGVTLKAFEDYHGGKAAIDTVNYKVITENSAAVIAFENGELDYFTDVPLSDWENIKAAAGEEDCDLAKGNNIRFMSINYLSDTNNGILGNEKVREAIFHAVNKDAVVAVATGGYGQVAYEYMPSDYVATAPKVSDGKFATYDFDAEKVKSLLKEAGFTDADIAAGINVGTILTYGEQTADKGKAQIVIQDNLKACGLIANVECAEAANVTPRMYAQNYDIAIFADSGNYDYNNIRQQVHSESTGMYIVDFAAKGASVEGTNKTSPFNWQRLEELVDLGVATADTAARYDIYTELWSIVMDTKTILPLYHQATGIAWSDRINVETINPTYYHLVDFSWAE